MRGCVRWRSSAAATSRGDGDFCQAEIENFGVAAIGDKNVGGLDVAMDDALLVGGVESVGDFDGRAMRRVEFQGAAGDAGA